MLPIKFYDFYDIDEIRAFLRLNKIKEEDYSDDELKSIINQQINKIEAETGRELTETPHKDIELHFKKGSREYNLTHFPVTSIKKISIDNIPVSPLDFIYDSNYGIIKFKKPIIECEILEVEYYSKESDIWIKQNILPLLEDMLLYSFSNDGTNDISSIKEGEISINYDTANSLHSLILKRLDKLRLRPLTRML